MNSTKTIDLLRKRNAQMQEELDRMKELNLKFLDSDEQKEISKLLEELENIKRGWLHVLEELNGQREEYTELIDELRQMRKAFKPI